MRRSEAAAPARSSSRRDEKKKTSTLKVPMPDPVTEQVMLAAGLVDRTVRKKLITVISPDFFFAEGHPEAWELAIMLEREGLEWDPATAKQLMGDRVDVGYLDDLTKQRPAAPPNLQHHLEVLRWNRARVEAVRGPLGGLVDAIADPTAPPSKVLGYLKSATGLLEGHGTLRYLRDPKKLRAEQMAEIRKRRAGLACFPFGLAGFDQYADGPLEGQWRMIPGAAPKAMTVITGVPGCGKTTVTARMAVEQANQERRVLFGAWEQGSGLTLELCAQVSLGISRTALSTGQIDDATEAALDAEMDRLSDWIRFFELPFDRGAAETLKKWEVNDRHLDTIFEYLVATTPDVAIFDLWRRAIGDFDPDAEERALYRQQAMLQETNVHGMLIHQLRAKELEQRADKTPTREALKGSGAWFEVPDTIIGLHREFLWKAVKDDTLRAVILKQRKGVWPLAVDFPWNADTGWIGEGACAEYVRPGTKSNVDSFLDGDQPPASAAAWKERNRGAKKESGKRRRLGS